MNTMTAQQLEQANRIAIAAAVGATKRARSGDARLKAQAAEDAIREVARFDCTGDRLRDWERLWAEDARGSATWRVSMSRARKAKVLEQEKASIAAQVIETERELAVNGLDPDLAREEAIKAIARFAQWKPDVRAGRRRKPVAA